MHNVLSNSMAPIPMHRVAILRPFAQLLSDVGVPVERAFRKAGLPGGALENINNYVPSYRFWSFLVNTAYDAGIPDLGFRVGCSSGANSADPNLTCLLQRSPTLYHGLRKASELINSTITNCRVGLVSPPCSEHCLFFHSPSCDGRNPAIEQIGWFGVTTLIGMVRQFTGPKWQPREIGIMAKDRPNRLICEALPRTRIRPSQPYSYVELNKTTLSLPPFAPEKATQAVASTDYSPFATNFVGSLERVICTYLRDRDLSLGLVAELCNTSKRTLQRRLTEAGTSYFEALDHARFHTARNMLQDPDISVTDVSNLLGYSDPTHFSRAFRRVAVVAFSIIMQGLSISRFFKADQLKRLLAQ